MGRYRKIDVRIWNDEAFASLSDDGKLAFLFVLTHPNMTPLGAMRATIEGLAAELRWTPERLRKAFREGFHEGFSGPSRKPLLELSERHCFVGIPGFLRYNQPASPNVVRSWPAWLDLIPECELKDRLLQRLKDFTKALGEAFMKAFREALPEAFPEAFAKALPKQKQKQKQEQNIENPLYPPSDNRLNAVIPTSDALPLDEHSDVTEDNQRPTDRRAKSPMPPIPAELDKDPFRQAWSQWVAYRRERRSSLTPRTAAMQLKKLARHPPEIAARMIEQSIEHGWMGLFEIKEERNGKPFSAADANVAAESRQYPTGSTAIARGGQAVLARVLSRARRAGQPVRPAEVDAPTAIHRPALLG